MRRCGKRMNEYIIWYCNPNIRNDELRILTDHKNKRVVIKARNEKEAERKTAKRLATTGMCYEIERMI